MAEFDTIQNNLASRDRFRKERVSQREIVPSAVKERHWLSGKIYAKTVVSTFTDLLTLSNGNDEFVNFTFTHSKEYDLLLPEVYIARYINSIVSTQQLPGGSGVTESQWIWTAPEFDYGAWDGSRNKSVILVYIRNVSAGASQTVSFKLQAKFIAGTPTL